ncbi:MAG: hypothetical protein KC983_05910 [Phycisphaerales bacterium]|nr:hypothetical protein [Phycisphaerales bacterium]
MMTRHTLRSARPNVARAVIFPLGGPPGGIDVTDRIVATIADAIADVAGGNRTLDHLEAEIHLQTLLDRGHPVDRGAIPMRLLRLHEFVPLHDGSVVAK